MTEQDRITTLRWSVGLASYRPKPINPVPAYPGSPVFFVDGDVYLVESYAESEARCAYQTKKEGAYTKFKKFWQYIDSIGGTIVLKLRG